MRFFRHKAAPLGLLHPDIFIPFAVVSLIWGSTWFVIRDQLGVVPPSWSVAYRFGVAAIAMFILAGFRKAPLWIGWYGMAFALTLGLCQFALNFNLVYRAELFITSGLVAVLYALLLIPNALLARIFLKQRLSREFLIGSAIAIGGMALLFIHEYHHAQIASAKVLLGIAFSLAGIISASISNVMQGAHIARRLPMESLLAWAMLLGAALDGIWAWILTGPPVMELRPAYIGGILYLALAGSVVTFPLYFRLIQTIGAARAAYTGVMIPILAMLLSTMFENYAWSALAILGAGLSLVGLIVALRARSIRPAL